MSERALQKRLAAGLDASWQRVHGARLAALATRLHRAGVQPADTAAIRDGLAASLERDELAWREVQLATTLFRRRVAHATDADAIRRHVLALAAQLGARGRALRADARATLRQFDSEAVLARAARREGELQQSMAFTLERYARIACENAPPLQPGKLDEVLVERMTGAFDERVRVAACTALARVLEAGACTGLSAATQRLLVRLNMDTHQPLWLEVAALRALEAQGPSGVLLQVARRRVRPQRHADDAFYRARLVAVLARRLPMLPALEGCLRELAADPAAWVRQALARSLHPLPPALGQSLAAGLQADAQPAVRGRLLLQLPRLVAQPEWMAPARDLLQQTLRQERVGFVLRVCLETTLAMHATLLNRDADAAGEFARWADDQLRALQPGWPLPLQRRCAQALERLWVQSEPRRRQLYAELRPLLDGTPMHRHLLIETPQDLATDELARLLAVMAVDDAGFELRRGRSRTRIRRGTARRWRFWRWWYELRHPRTDKRQAYAHTVGRHYGAREVVPSAIMAEVSQTSVPGEPLVLRDEAGWRPFLPLVDQAISACGLRARPLRIHTAHGITEIYPPRGLRARLRARLQLSLAYPRLAELRNWRSGDTAQPEIYRVALESLGLRLRFVPRRDDADGAAAQRFFGAGATAVVLPPSLLQQFGEYFVSLYQNSLRDLLLFLALLGALFIGQHLRANLGMARYRRGIGLSIGGWGTRGKSGTERLKAALIEAMGLGYVAKTTGCEAMFVYAPPFGRARELFLFRPYDKASIWEQVDVMRIAHGLRAEAFLWECMALNPDYVHTLQRQWMHDDLATITNTYPDHEDIQGPAGLDVAEVMRCFVPEGARLYTADEDMTPLLADEARRRGSTLTRVGWLEAGLLTPDMLARFPYDEHPNNVALVLALAADLGLDEDYALKEMADRVVPDLGVLKTYPRAPVRGRWLEFVMGMSANERLGCLNNWERTGFADHDPRKAPGVWISTVVNNRDDRIARSQVFAGILVRDLSADCHVLIGSNLDGLQSYIRDTFREWAAEISLSAAGDAPAELERQARRLRVPTEGALVEDRLAAMLEGLGAPQLAAQAERWRSGSAGLAEALTAAGLAAHLEDLLATHERHLAELATLREWRERLQAGRIDDAAFREQLWQWFQARILVIPDRQAKPDEIVTAIAARTPPGFVNRIMGLQNIKGTGLGFVYAWQDWEQQHADAATLLRLCPPEERGPLLAQAFANEGPARDPAEARRHAEAAVARLQSASRLGLLGREALAAVVETLRGAPEAQSETMQAELNQVQELLEASGAERQATQQAEGGWRLAVLRGLEQALDSLDAIYRRRRADAIYRELCAQRIAPARAQQELMQLTHRQKGDWLIARLRRQGLV